MPVDVELEGWKENSREANSETKGQTNLGFDSTEQTSERPTNPDQKTYIWKDINVYASVSKKTEDGSENKKLFSKTEKQTKHILKNVTGCARPGEFLAIMGSSGAGKTTLLNVLTCRNTGKLKVEGSTRVNGEVVDRNMLASISAYIQQTDVFIGTLTPREHLQFQATLRMDQRLPLKDRMERVEKVINEMGLTACADVLIGIPGRVKGLSGGQQKRLAIASEILSDPSILFCDEPTTGLDSFMAQSIVKQLKALASKGKIVICTIHQPSSEVYALFDRLLLMSEGSTAFLGDCNDALTLFADFGLPCPENYNPADFFIFTLAIRAGHEESCLERSKQVCSSFEASQRAQDINTFVNSELVKYTDESKKGSAKKVSPYKASWMTQFSACLWRSWKTVLHDPLLLKAQFAQSVFLSVVIGLVFLRQENDQEGVQNISGFIFMCLANLTFSSVFPVCNVFWNELPVFMREHYNGTYRTDSYYLGKTVAELPIYIAVPAIFMTIGYWMVGLNPAGDRYLIAVAIAVLVANVASSYGYMCSTISSSLEMALAIAPVFIMPLFLFGGSFLNKDSIPVYFVWLKYLSWFMHGNEALSVNQWKGVEEIECNRNRTADGVGCIENGAAVLEHLSFKEDNFWLAIGILSALIVLGRVLSYIGLLAKTRKEE